MDAPEPQAPVQDASAPAAGAAAPAPPPAPVGPPPKRYEFSRSTLLAERELHKFKEDHDEILAALGTKLSIHFRMECEFTLASLQTPTFRQFVSRLARPTHLTLFKVEPLRGICVLEIQPELGLAMTDRLMGGPGVSKDATRELSEIEVSLLDQIVHFITEDWCAHWSDWQPLKPTLLGHENEPRYLQTSPTDSNMLLVGIKVRLGECTSQIQMAFPFATLEPLMEKRRDGLKPATGETPAPAPRRAPKWNPAFDDVQIRLAAELPGPRLPARAIARLQVGQVIPLSSDALQRVQLLLGGKPRFQGQLGSNGTKMAVQITSLIKS